MQTLGRKLFVWVLGIILGAGFLPRSAVAQAAWTHADIGDTGAAGSFTDTSGVYTVNGAGRGAGSTTDALSFVYVPADGNVEIIARINSQTNPSPYAQAGLMIRQDLAAGSKQAAVTISPKNGVNFVFRTSADQTAVTTLGGTKVAPQFLRLVKSGNSLAGFVSGNGWNWTSVGSCSLTLGGSFYIGLTVSSAINGTLGTGVFQQVAVLRNVPQREPNLLMWLRPDVDVVANGSNQVSQWLDQSGNGLNAFQSTGANQPLLSANALNGFPVLSFNGSTQFLQLLPGFANFTSGLHIVLLQKSTAAPNNSRFIDLGNGSTVAHVDLYRSLTSANFGIWVYNVNGYSVLSSTNPLVLNLFQILEASHDGNSQGSIYLNWANRGSGPLPVPNNVLRHYNYLARGVWAASLSAFFQGQIVEVLVYDRQLTSQERTYLQVYFQSKFGIGGYPPQAAPTFAPKTGTYAIPQSISLTGPDGAIIHYTTDGSSPTSASPVYTGPIDLSETTTLKAIAVRNGFSDSAIASSTYSIDASTSNLPRNNLIIWLRADTGVNFSSGSSVMTWSDQSGLEQNAFQSTPAAQPQLVTNAVNGKPALTFNGTTQFLEFGPGLADFTQGMSVFLVLNPFTSTISNGRFFEFANDSLLDNITFCRQTITSGVAFYVLNGSTSSYIIGDSALTNNKYQLLEAIHNGSAFASIYSDGILRGNGTLLNIPNIPRTLNYLAMRTLAGSPAKFDGGISEVLIYNRGLTIQERIAVEEYLMSKYAIGRAAPLPPTFSVPSGTTFAVPSQVAINAPANSTIYFTMDGSTPTTSSAVYAGPLNVAWTQTVKAIAVREGYGSSAVASASYTLNATHYPNPNSATSPPAPVINLELPTNAVLQP